MAIRIISTPDSSWAGIYDATDGRLLVEGETGDIFEKALDLLGVPIEYNTAIMPRPGRCIPNLSMSLDQAVAAIEASS